LRVGPCEREAQRDEREESRSAPPSGALAEPRAECGRAQEGPDDSREWPECQPFSLGDRLPYAYNASNWMFAGSPRGARAAATMYSLIGTARLNGIEPYAWLERTLEKLPSYPVNRVHELLPLAR
jgi:hypothetical protein